MSSNPLRRFFPVFSDASQSDWIYLDSAATSQKLNTVIAASQQYYQQGSVNVHRSSHQLAANVTQNFESARRTVQHFIHAASHKEIVWTKGATESINLVAQGLAQGYFKAGQEIVISALEHHANIVPWQQVAQNLGLTLKIMPIDENGVLQLEQSLALINDNTALVAVGHVSNALGNINPIEAIIAKSKEVGALTLIDGTQAVSHLTVDVQQLDCDFYVFSGHKMFGPTGIGVLYGKLKHLEELPPYQFGGEMIERVSFEQTDFQSPPLKFEAGTPNIVGVLGIALAAEFIMQHRQQLLQIENAIYQQLIASMLAIPQLKLWGELQHSISLLSFTIQGIDPYDLAVLLDKQNIALRVGHHCAMPLMNELGIDGTIRVSLSVYNTAEEVTGFIQALTDAINILTASKKQPSAHPMQKDKLDLSQTLPLAESIKQAKGWDQTYRQLMLAGKQLDRLADSGKTSLTEVFGCESQVWIECRLEAGTLKLKGDSPSKIVRGLLAVIIEVLHNQSIDYVLDFDLSNYLGELKLGRHLSQSRGNGLTAVVNKIIQFCRDNKSIE